MDHQASERDLIKWIRCPHCGLRGLSITPTEYLNNEPISTKYARICIHCNKSSKSNEVFEYLDVLPFQNGQPHSQELRPAEEGEDGTQYEQQLQKGRKILHININGLSNKYEEVRDFLINENNILLCAITETKLKPRNHDNMFDIPNYFTHRVDRIGKEGGGTIVYVNQNLNYQICEPPLQPPELVECVIVKLLPQFQKPMHVVTMYIPPDKINDSVFDFIEKLTCYLRSLRSDFSIIGDFNIDLFKKSNETSKLTSITKECGLYQLIKAPTREATRMIKNRLVTTKTKIDHFYASKNNMFSSSGVLDFSSTDHKMIFAIQTSKQTKATQKLIECRNYRQFKQEDFDKEIASIDWSFIEASNYKENNVSIFESIIIGILDKHAPYRKRLVKGMQAPWFTSELKNMCRERDKLKSKCKTDKSGLMEYRKMRNLTNNSIRAAKKKFFNDKLDKVKNSAGAWSDIDELFHYRTKTNPKLTKLISNNGEIIESDNSICDQLATEFLVKEASSTVTNCYDYLHTYKMEYEQYNLDNNIVSINEISISTEEINEIALGIDKCVETKVNIPKKSLQKFYRGFTNPIATIIFSNI